MDDPTLVWGKPSGAYLEPDSGKRCPTPSQGGRTAKEGSNNKDHLRSITALLITPFVLLAFIVVLSEPVCAVTQYNITDLGALGGSYSYAYGINDLGQIVGYGYWRWVLVAARARVVGLFENPLLHTSLVSVWERYP